MHQAQDLETPADPAHLDPQDLLHHHTGDGTDDASVEHEHAHDETDASMRTADLDIHHTAHGHEHAEQTDADAHSHASAWEHETHHADDARTFDDPYAVPDDLSGHDHVSAGVPFEPETAALHQMGSGASAW